MSSKWMLLLTSVGLFVFAYLMACIVKLVEWWFDKRGGK